MGIFDIFKPKQKAVEIKLEHVEPWLNIKIKEIEKKHSEKIKPLFEKFETHKRSTKEQLEALVKAKLRHDNLQPRVKQIMEGNRDSYIRNVKMFLEKVSAPNSSQRKDLEPFLERYDAQLERFGSSSAKAFYVLKEFLSNEVSKVAGQIHELDRTVKSIKSFAEKQDKRLKSYDELVSELNTLYEDIHNYSEFNVEVKAIEEEYADIEKKRKKVSKERDYVKYSDEYKEFETFNTRLQSHEEKQSEIEKQVRNEFAVLERALRKYSKITIEPKIVENYLEDPFKALLGDSSFAVVGVFKKIKDAIKEHKITLKDKKEDKSLQMISKLTRKHLSSLTVQYDIEEKTITELKKRIRTNKTSLRLKELDYRVEYLETREKRLAERDKELKEKMEKSDVVKDKEAMIKKLKNMFNLDVTSS